MRKKEKTVRPIIGSLHSPQNKLNSLDQFKPKTTKNSSLKHQLTPGRRERLLKVLTKEKAKDSLVLKYLQDRISKVKNGENSGLDIIELETLEQEMKKRMPIKQLVEKQQKEQKKEINKVLKEIKQNEIGDNKGEKNINSEVVQLKGKWRNEQQAKTLNPDDEASPKSIYEMPDDQDEYDLIVKYNTEQYKRNLQQQFIEKKKQQQLLGESYSQQIEHKKLQKKLEDLQQKRIKDQYDSDVQKFKQEQVLAKLKEKEKIKQQSDMIKESLDNYNQKKKFQNSLIYNEGAEYQGQASRAAQQEKEEKRMKKQFELKFFKQLEDLTEEEKRKALEIKKQEKEEERKLLQDRVQQLNRMDEQRYQDKEKAQQKANIIENIITPSAESHFSTKTQKIANQELLCLKQAYVLGEQERQKEYERQHRQKELKNQINSILDLQIKQKQALKEQEKCDDIEQSNIFRLNDREYLTQQNQINRSIKSQNQLHAEQLRKQIEVDKEKKQADKFMSINEVIYNKNLLKNASSEVSDYSRVLTKREVMLPRIQKNIYNSNLF